MPRSRAGEAVFWLRDLRASLRTLLDLPLESVLVSHGAPVLQGGTEALGNVLRAS